MRILASMLVALCIAPAAGLAQTQPRALTVKSLNTGKRVYSPGLIVFHKGRIVAMGSPSKLKAPEGAMSVSLPQFYITPGIVDTNSQRGVDGSLSEIATRLTPGFSAADTFDPFVKGFAQATQGGVTHMVFAPDGGGILAGKGILLGAGEPHMGVALRRELALFGSLAPSAYRSNYEPSTRSKAVTYIRKLFSDAHRGKLHPNADFRSWRPDSRVLRDVLAGKLPLAMRIGSSGDALVAIKLFEDLKIRGILIGGNASLHKVLEEIKAAKVPLILDPLSVRDSDRTLRLPAQLAGAGIPFTFSSRAPMTLESGLLSQGALAVLHGLDGKRAWKALTSTPASIFSLPDGGVLKVGGSANFLIFTGDPTTFTAPLATTVSGGRWDGQRLMQAMRAGGGRRR